MVIRLKFILIAFMLVLMSLVLGSVQARSCHQMDANGYCYKDDASEAGPPRYDGDCGGGPGPNACSGYVIELQTWTVDQFIGAGEWFSVCTNMDVDPNCYSVST